VFEIIVCFKSKLFSDMYMSDRPAKTLHSKLIPAAILFWLLSGLLASGQSGEIPKGITDALKAGNSNVLSQFFNTNLELSLPSVKDDIYSKQQAELIIREFFTKHVPTAFAVLHQGGPAESQYAIGTLSTGSGSFRVTLLIKQTNGKQFIHQIRFEEENAD
jgi:hypothetical protein